MPNLVLWWANVANIIENDFDQITLLRRIAARRIKDMASGIKIRLNEVIIRLEAFVIA